MEVSGFTSACALGLSLDTFGGSFRVTMEGMILLAVKTSLHHIKFKFTQLEFCYRVSRHIVIHLVTKRWVYFQSKNMEGYAHLILITAFISLLTKQTCLVVCRTLI